MEKLYMRLMGSAIVVLLTLQAQAGPMSEAELSKRLASYQNLKAFEVPFQQTKKLKGLDLKLRSKGLLTVHRQSPYLISWKVTEPAPLEIRIEEKKVEIISGEPQKQTRQSFDPKQAGSQEATKGFARLGAWMRMDATELARNYNIEAEAGNQISFQPREPDSIRQVKLQVGPNGQLKSMKLFEASDDEVEIEFGNLKSR